MNEWRKLKLRSIGFLCFDAPEHLRWHWVNTTERGETRLYLVSPRGRWWHFKLNGGAWIKPMEKNDSSRI